MKQILELLGVSGTAIAYAVGTFGFFHLLDKRASGPAKRAMTEWLSSADYNKEQVAAALQEMFERLYAYPFLSLRCIVRLVTISLVLHLIIYYHFEILPWDINLIVFVTFFNIASDYVSLFIVRRWLIIGGTRPMLALLTGPLIGYLVICTMYAGPFIVFEDPTQVYLIYMLITDWVNPALASPEDIIRRFLMPAFVIHLWLPLLALAIIFARALRWIAWATQRMQWFLKRGKDHPFDALGFVASGIVLVIAITVPLLPAPAPNH